ncbi:MAG: tetratricopeptide repeat protein [Patescibacteria group bacterium]|mgnify:CR=1 FL=1
MNKKAYYGLAAGLVVIAVGFGVYKSGIFGSHENIDKNKGVINKGVEGEGQFQVTPETGEGSQVKQPNLDRQVVVGDATLSEATKKVIFSRIGELVGQLKKDGKKTDVWTELGLNLKMIGDYRGAEEVWQYVLALQPGNHIVQWNLGNLYAEALKDYPRAEAMYKKAIAAKSDEVGFYQGFYEFYRYQYTAKIDKADDVLKDGIAKNVGDISLVVSLARYYRETNQIELAKEYYQKAIERAHTAKNVAAEKAIQEELQTL